MNINFYNNNKEVRTKLIGCEITLVQDDFILAYWCNQLYTYTHVFLCMCACICKRILYLPFYEINYVKIYQH